MKPLSLLFFSLIILSSVSFGITYVFWADLVEANPIIFTLVLLAVIIVGMGGMMFNLIYNTHSKEE